MSYKVKQKVDHWMIFIRTFIHYTNTIGTLLINIPFICVFNIIALLFICFIVYFLSQGLNTILIQVNNT